MKKGILIPLLLVILASCTSPRAATIATSTPIIRASETPTIHPTLVETPYILHLTPQITATPVAFRSGNQDLDQIIGRIYGISVACNQPDTAAQEKPEFTDISKWVKVDQLYIDEIADNENKTYRAYLVEEPVRDVCNACFRSRVYSMKFSTGEAYMISWKGYLPGRVLFRLIWIGDRILAFEQSLSPHVGEIVAVDVQARSFVYHSFSSDFCK